MLNCAANIQGSPFRLLFHIPIIFYVWLNKLFLIVLQCRLGLTINQFKTMTTDTDDMVECKMFGRLFQQNPLAYLQSGDTFMKWYFQTCAISSTCLWSQDGQSVFVGRYSCLRNNHKIWIKSFMVLNLEKQINWFLIFLRPFCKRTNTQVF